MAGNIFATSESEKNRRPGFNAQAPVSGSLGRRVERVDDVCRDAAAR